MMSFVGLAWTVLLGLLASRTVSSESSDTSYRLPESVVPQNYDLELVPHLGTGFGDNFDFHGRVKITVKCLYPTSNITLHSNNLTIHEKEITLVDITSNASSVISVTKVNLIKENDFLVIDLEKSLLEDHDYELFISFTGKLLDDLKGFYRSSYVDHKTKKKRWLAVTQFEATHAREAFPCFDEPAMKATFKISLGRAENYSSISNMPIINTEPISDRPGWFWDRYEQSVPMSTYLVAFVVSDFAYRTSPISGNNNVTFKIWARNDFIEQTKLAEEVGPKCLAYYESYFDIEYPLPKQDMIAVPDFSAGAMENWGLITYREALLLYDANKTSASNKDAIASVIAHELAHQWFGNLVTMKWWTDLWLNEGFATYMASVAVDYLYPEWNSLDEDIAANLLAVFGLDALKTSHPVSVTVGNPNEISEIFDTISYKKGSFLLHMIGAFLGKDTFRKGVTRYLNAHRYNNAQQDDLWTALTDQAKEDRVLPDNLTVKMIMDKWTLQTGYPLLTIKRDYTKHTVKITQKRFLKDIAFNGTFDECWWVPLTYALESEIANTSTMPRAWISCSEDSLIVYNLSKSDDWILFNINATALYKINYDEENWRRLVATLNSNSFKNIPVLNRVQLIDDASDLAWVGSLTYDVLFDTLAYLTRESSYLPWKAGSSNIDSLNNMLKRTALYGDFRSYVKEFMTPAYEQFGGLQLKYQGDDLSSLKHQLLMNSLSCKFEVGDCVQKSLQLFKQWQNNSQENPIKSDLKNLVYCMGVKHGAEEEWNFLWNQYLTTKVPTERTTILRALTCTDKVWLIIRYLDWSLDERSGVRSQDAGAVFQNIASTDVGYFVAKNFLYSRISRIHSNLSGNFDKISRYISTIAKQMIYKYDLEEFTNFITVNSKYLTESRLGVKQSLETIQVNIQWHEKHYDEVKELLYKKKSSH